MGKKKIIIIAVIVAVVLVAVLAVATKHNHSWRFLETIEVGNCVKPQIERLICTKCQETKVCIRAQPKAL